LLYWKEWNFVISSNFNLELVLFTSISPLSLPLRFGKIPKLFYFIWYMKDFFLSMICEKSDGRQFHQYQQSKQSPLNLNWTRLTKKRPRNPVSDLYIWSLILFLELNSVTCNSCLKKIFLKFCHFQLRKNKRKDRLLQGFNTPPITTMVSSTTNVRLVHSRKIGYNTCLWSMQVYLLVTEHQVTLAYYFPSFPVKKTNMESYFQIYTCL
jgi:hypothetical protein